MVANLIPDSVIEDIGRRTEILDVVGSYVTLNRKGDRWWGLCPFHTEKTPSFSVSPETNLFYCFGCHKGGGVFQFLMELEGLSFPEAVRQLGEKAGVEVPDDAGETVRDNRKALQELYARVSKTLQWLLWNQTEAEHARNYLQQRGISRETADDYRLGWAPRDGEWLYRFLLGKNYSPEFLSETGLFSRKSPKWAFFVDRLMFPVMPDSERVVAFSGRALSERDDRKYINSPETSLYRKSRELYGYGQAKQTIRKKRTAVLCEGNLDVLSCMQAGIPETVAPLGTAFTEEQAKLLKRQADDIILVFDGDSAGRKASMKAAIIAEKTGLNAKAVALPSGEDPSDLLNREGPDYLKKVIGNPINIFDYLLDFLISAKSDFSGEAQEEALEDLTPYLDSVGSEVKQDAYLRQMADAMNADPSAVIREFRNRRGKRQSKIERKAESLGGDASGTGGVIDAGDELFLMAAVAVRTEYFTTLRKMLAPELLRDRRALSVYRIIDEMSSGGTEPRTDAIVSQIEDGKVADFIMRQASSSLFDERAEETIVTLIRKLKAKSLSEERAELTKRLTKNEDGDSDLSNARILRIQEIDREIMDIRQGKDGGNQV